MSQIRTRGTFSYRNGLRSLGASAVLLGAVACSDGAGLSNGGSAPPITGPVGRAPSANAPGYPGAPASAPGYPGSDAGAPGYGPTGYASDCTYTQGYWKNHEEAWPVNELRLGTTTYTKTQLLDILRTPVSGNGLVALAHQLIAARLNLASGASPLGLEGTLAAADALIGARVIPPVGKGSLPTSETSKLNDELTAFNEGKVGPGHCEKGRPPAPTPPPSPPAPPPPPVAPPSPPTPNPTPPPSGPPVD